MQSTKKIARVTGILYLIIIIFAGFAEGFVRTNIIVPGDAAATAKNIVDSEFLFRSGFVADLIAFICDIAVTVLLYILLKPVNKNIALLAAFFRLIAHPAIAGINLLNYYSPLLLLSGSDYLNDFNTQQLNALTLVYLNAHNIGYLIAGAFFSVHCFLLGYLLYKSNLFPTFLGILIIIASIGYFIESFGSFLFPGGKEIYTAIVTITAVIGEFSLTLYLLIKGVKKDSTIIVETG